MREGAIQNIFIMAMGRSGGTLLKKIINCDTKFEIHGENHGVLRNIIALDHVMSMTRSISYTGAEKPFSSNNTAWHGYTRYSVQEVLYSTLGLRRDVISGFKEVRHGGGSFEEFCGEMDFLLSALPHSLIVLNTRDLDSVVRSQVKNWDRGDESCSALRRKVAQCQYENFQRYHERVSDRTYQLDYQNIVSCDSVFLKFLDTIGYGHDTGFVHKVLQFNIG